MLTPGDVKSANESSSPSGLPPPNGRTLSSWLSASSVASATRSATETAIDGARRRAQDGGGTTPMSRRTSGNADADGGRRRSAAATGTTTTAANVDGSETETTSGRSAEVALRDAARADAARLVLALAPSLSTPVTPPPPLLPLSPRMIKGQRSARSRRPSSRLQADSSAKRESMAKANIVWIGS